MGSEVKRSSPTRRVTSTHSLSVHGISKVRHRGRTNTARGSVFSPTWACWRPRSRRSSQTWATMVLKVEPFKAPSVMMAVKNIHQDNPAGWGILWGSLTAERIVLSGCAGSTSEPGVARLYKAQIYAKEEKKKGVWRSKHASGLTSGGETIRNARGGGLVVYICCQAVAGLNWMSVELFSVFCFQLNTALQLRSLTWCRKMFKMNLSSCGHMKVCTLTS